MHGLNEELGRHRGREGRSQSILCNSYHHDECESIAYYFCYGIVQYKEFYERAFSLGSKFSQFLS